MNRRAELLNGLVEGLDALAPFREPPEVIAPQFAAWLCHVGTAFRAAGMDSDLSLWNDALTQVRFAEYESSMDAQMKATKSILLAMLHRYEVGQPADPLFDMEIVTEAKSCVRRVAAQAIGCYENGWYDACMVMVRRLLETLVIECYESRGIAGRIMNKNGDYLFLGDLLDQFLSEPSWRVSRNGKTYFPRLKEIKAAGDIAAHSRCYLTSRQDVESIKKLLSFCIQELIYIAGDKASQQSHSTA